MPNDSSGKARVNDGWNGAIAQKGGTLEEGWPPATEKDGFLGLHLNPCFFGCLLAGRAFNGECGLIGEKFQELKVFFVQA